MIGESQPLCLGAFRKEREMFFVKFEVTSQSGNLFSHEERFQVVGLARVRVRERQSERFSDWSGTVRRFTAKSSRPFVVVVISDHHMNDKDGTDIDLSEVRTLQSVAA